MGKPQLYFELFLFVSLQELATEIILTLGQAFEIAYQMALQEQQQQPKPEAAEGTPADPPPPEGAGVAGVTTTSQQDGSRDNNSHDKQTDVNSEIDNITQRVTNTHIHQSAETTQPVKDDVTTTTTTTTKTSSQKEPGRHPDSGKNKSRADPSVMDPQGQAAIVGAAALGKPTACHNTTRTESTV